MCIAVSVPSVSCFCWRKCCLSCSTCKQVPILFFFMGKNLRTSVGVPVTHSHLRCDAKCCYQLCTLTILHGLKIISIAIMHNQTIYPRITCRSRDSVFILHTESINSTESNGPWPPLRNGNNIIINHIVIMSLYKSPKD